MRNDWYPRHKAAYIPLPEQKKLGLKTALLSRKYNFTAASDMPTGERLPEAAEVRAAFALEAQIEAERISVRALLHFDIYDGLHNQQAERSVELLRILVPTRLDFFRVPIGREEAPSAAAEDAPSPQSEQQKTAIHGSVSTADVAANITAILATNDEAARIRLSDTDVSFRVAEGEDSRRVRHVGDFEVDVQIRGAPEPVMKIVRVIPADRV